MLSDYHTFFSILTANERTQLAMTLNPGNPRDAVATWNQKRDGQDKEYLRQVQDAVNQVGLGEKTKNLFKALDDRDVVSPSPVTPTLTPQQQEKADIEKAIAESLKPQKPPTDHHQPNPRPLPQIPKAVSKAVPKPGPSKPKPVVKPSGNAPKQQPKAAPGKLDRAANEAMFGGLIGGNVSAGGPKKAAPHPVPAAAAPKPASPAAEPYTPTVYMGAASASRAKFKQSANLALPGDDIRIPQDPETFPRGAGNQNDFRHRLAMLPLPLMMHYGAGGNASTYSGMKGFLQLPCLDEQNIQNLKNTGVVDLAPFVQQLQTKSIPLYEVPVYVFIRTMPAGNKTDQPSVNNYMCHPFTHTTMVANKTINCAAGVLGADGISPGPDNSIGFNGNMATYGQNFHDANMLSGNMNKLTIAPYDKAKPQTVVSSGWFLAQGSEAALNDAPHRQAVLCFELWVKDDTFNKTSAAMETTISTLKPDPVTGNLGDPVLKTLLAEDNALVGKTLHDKLKPVFDAFGV